ncbi:MAG TPA: DUF397 domain-containing protein [Actinophytocola sp.]|uniref:DUF397 domain-containing protein n=1 Tax=Actinophytocola sp. TaxID=1872138 RepID=UPI002DBB1501|nr:DUF397 domain-containing protein [Actinophytocola sp.]HEU5470271.1 DUF397 domain-containing protein [Actinophytocola sp.]
MPTAPRSLRWRTSSFSSNGPNCVQVAHDLTALRDSKNPTGPILQANLRTFLGAVRWRVSSFSSNGTNCVEVAHDLTALRDSKNPTGPVLQANLRTFLRAVQDGPDHLRWRTSSFSSNGPDCVEVAHDLTALRDSKNPTGPLLRADLRHLLQAVQTIEFRPTATR